jgi:HSP20 family protein
MRQKIIELIGISLEKSDIFEPECDVFEKRSKVYVELEISGLDENNFKIEIDANMLYVFGVKKRVGLRGAKYLRAERIFGSFRKVIAMPCNIKAVENITYEDGILRIIMSKG